MTTTPDKISFLENVVERQTDETTAPHLHSLPQKQELQKIEATWIAVQELKRPHKEKVKFYYSVLQGHDGTIALCFFCKKLFGFHDLEIHHHDHNKRNNNLANLAPACGPCNNAERASWLSERNRHPGATGDTLSTHQKQTADGMVVQAAHDEAKTLNKAPWTSQKKVSYRHKALVHLLRLKKAGVLQTGRAFDALVYDVEALTGCSHDKAIEYLDGWSISSYAPFAKFKKNSEGEDPNELGTGEFMIKEKSGWNQDAYATEEYLKALAEVEAEERPSA